MCRLQHRQSLQKQVQEHPSASQADKGFQCTGLDVGSYHNSSEAQQACQAGLHTAERMLKTIAQVSGWTLVALPVQSEE